MRWSKSEEGWRCDEWLAVDMSGGYSLYHGGLHVRDFPSLPDAKAWVEEWVRVENV